MSAIIRLTLVGIVISSMIFASAAVYAQAINVQSASPLGSKDIGKTETSIGNLFADALRNQMGTDVAFVAASEIKEKDPPISAGKVVSTELTALVSYPDDPLAVVEITGTQIRQTLERSVSVYPQTNLGFLQVSGLSFTFDPKANVGQRVTSITIGGAPISDNRAYSVGITNSMANGALGYWKVWTKQDIRRRAPDMTLVKAIETFLKSNPRIDYSSLNRITAR